MSKKDNHPISTEAINHYFPKYASELVGRLFNGAEVYGDDSFDKSTESLLAEIKQELLDISGWSFIAWCRINRALGKMENETTKDDKDSRANVEGGNE